MDACQLTITGIVQGVGFRPFIYRLAKELKLCGEVSNTDQGVIIKIWGKKPQIDAFLTKIQSNAPPLSRIDKISVSNLDILHPPKDFKIVRSVSSNDSLPALSPDAATCRDCLNEMRDPKNRRYHYPFINCTNCGPRYTIATALPYDRPNTTMQTFEMCADCQAEYQNPLDRRFHAQPIACPVCGPQIAILEADGRTLPKKASDEVIELAIYGLLRGKILAIKGIGGFHLAVNAEDGDAVKRLRILKKRPSKPFALMMKLEWIDKICSLNQAEQAWLTSPAAPIVLLKKLKNPEIALSENIAPNIHELGIMLPYTPLHHLIFDHPLAPRCLVMTSANASDEPICIQNAEAIQKLGKIVDMFLVHNREISRRMDDSVMRIVMGKPQMLRRSRGFVSEAIPIKSNQKIVSLGADLKNTLCFTKQGQAILSQHIGDLASEPIMKNYKNEMAALLKLFNIEPALCVFDLHPDYHSTRHAGTFSCQHVQVQHHIAHAMAVMAEHDLTEPCLAVVMDGTGYGEDGTVWGGEFLLIDNGAVKRLGRLEHLRLLGGEKAAKEPWRMAFATIFHVFSKKFEQFLHLVPFSSEQLNSTHLMYSMFKQGMNSPLSSSCGRLFDAVAAMLGIRMFNEYEAQAAMELEALAWDALYKKLTTQNHYSVSINNRDQCAIVNSHAMLKEIFIDIEKKVNTRQIALKFHVWLSDAICEMIKKLLPDDRNTNIILTGGAMQNSLLLEMLLKSLTIDHYNVFTGEMIPVNDGGIALGQVFAATHLGSLSKS